MITVTDCQKLIDQWTDRMNNPVQSFDYRNALSECIDDMNRLITYSIQEELDYQDFLSMRADDYLSTMEAHEKVG